uniref:ZAD domain-containing protein n=1 Tax=Anopheles maculatus TaxID=74869 RepID=A0A182SA35_9DIPT
MCSAHFREDDFQMVNSPVIKQGKRIRHLNALAVPTIINRTPITVSTREKLDNVRKQLLEKLYTVDDNDDYEPPLGNDHTYSEAKVVTETEKKGPVDGCRKSIFFLQRYPNVCAFCLRIIQDPNFFVPVTHFHEELECTIEQKFDELTGDPMSQEDRSDVQHLLPDKVCNECVTRIIEFHQYQRQLECIKKFSTGIAHLLYGDEQPLENLYQDHGSYLVNILKHLDTAQGTRVNQSLEQLLEEVTSYGTVKRNAMANAYRQIAEDGMSIELCPSNTEQGVLSESTAERIASASPTPSSQSSLQTGQQTNEEATKSNDKNKSTQLHTC